MDTSLALVENKVLKYIPKKLITVIVPTFNSSSHIDGLIDSLNNQVDKDFELIVVDDNSDDIEILREKLRSRLRLEYRLIESKSKLYGNGARMTGVRASNGSYMAFCDSDDFFSNVKISILKKKILANMDVDLLWHKLNIVRNGKVVDLMPKRCMHESESVIEYLFCENGLMQSSSLVIKKSALMNMSIDESAKRHQDWDIVIDIWSRNGRFMFIDQVLGDWNIGVAWSIRNKESYNFSKNWMLKNGRYFRNGSRERIGFVVTVLLPKLIKSFSFIDFIDVVRFLSKNPLYAFGRVLSYTWKKLSFI